MRNRNRSRETLAVRHYIVYRQWNCTSLCYWRGLVKTSIFLALLFARSLPYHIYSPLQAKVWRVPFVLYKCMLIKYPSGKSLPISAHMILWLDGCSAYLGWTPATKVDFGKVKDLWTDAGFSFRALRCSLKRANHSYWLLQVLKGCQWFCMWTKNPNPLAPTYINVPTPSFLVKEDFEIMLQFWN